MSATTYLPADEVAAIRARLERAHAIPVTVAVRVALGDAMRVLSAYERLRDSGKRRGGSRQSAGLLAQWAERRAAIVAQYRAEPDVYTTARAFGISPTRVYRILRDAGIRSRLSRKSA